MLVKGTMKSISLLHFLFITESFAFVTRHDFAKQGALRATEMCPEIPLRPRPRQEMAVVASG
jgi:hypothetical protein